MPSPPSDLPALLQRYIDAKRRVDAEATPAELAEAKAWQQELRHRASARAANRAAFKRDVIARSIQGETAAAIAKAHNITERRIHQVKASLGLPTRHKTRPCQTPPLALTEGAMAALEKLAADRKLELAQAVAELLEILAENGARAARRHFYMPPQS